MLQQLAATTGTFIPTSALLLDVLHSTEVNRRARGAGTGKPLDFSSSLKVSKQVLNARQTQDALVSKVIALLYSELDIYKYNIAYPELIVPITMNLRKFTTKCRVPRWTTMIKGLIQSCDKHAHTILAKRANVDWSPKDVDTLETFLPAATPRAVDRIQQHRASVATTSTRTPTPSAPVAAATTPIVEVQKNSTASEPTTQTEAEEEEEDVVEDIVWSSDEEDD